MCVHELILHPHIEEDDRIFHFIRKINLIKKSLRKLIFKIFAVTMAPHCNSKNLNLNFQKKFLIKLIFVSIRRQLCGILWQKFQQNFYCVLEIDAKNNALKQH